MCEYVCTHVRPMGDKGGKSLYLALLQRAAYVSLQLLVCRGLCMMVCNVLQLYACVSKRERVRQDCCHKVSEMV